MHTNLTNINYFPTFHRSVTYQKQTQTHDDDNVDEASSLLTIATAAPSSSSSSSLRQDGVATTKKNGVPTMRAVIATCILLGTLAVIYSGCRSSSRSGGLSAALFFGYNQAAPVVYDPSQDFCFADDDNDDKYCWYPDDRLPSGNWYSVTDRGYNDCGSMCTSVHSNINDEGDDYHYRPDHIAST